MRNTKIIFPAICLLQFLAVNPALAIQPFFQSDEAGLSADISANNYVSIQEKLQFRCDSYVQDASSSRKTVSKRAISASYAVSCFEKGQASLVALAPDAESRERINKLLKPYVDESLKLKQVADSESEFMGMTWGVGFGYSFGSDDAIDDAEIINGIVRVKSEKKEQPRMLLEFHQFFWCNNNKMDGTKGCGPFVAVAATSDKLLSGVGMGFMYGRKAKAESSEGFSVGIGAILDGKVRDLADGFVQNQAPPTGETVVRFVEKSRWSGLLFVTRTF